MRAGGDPVRCTRSGFSMLEVAKGEGSGHRKRCSMGCSYMFALTDVAPNMPAGIRVGTSTARKDPPLSPVASTPRRIATRRCKMFVTAVSEGEKVDIPGLAARQDSVWRIYPLECWFKLKCRISPSVLSVDLLVTYKARDVFEELFTWLLHWKSVFLLRIYCLTLFG